MEIKRNIYLNKLITKKHNGLIKVVTGIRRCGKSYLLFDLFKDHLLAEGVDELHIIEIAFDSFENKHFRDPEVLYPYLKEQIKDDRMYYVLLDEVQLLGELGSVLNSLIRMKNVDVYVTGSNARFLSKDVITEFRGRGDEVHMHPLSFAEFMSVYSGTKQDGWSQIPRSKLRGIWLKKIGSITLFPSNLKRIGKLDKYFKKAKAGIIKLNSNEISIGDPVWARKGDDRIKTMIISLRLNDIDVGSVCDGEIGIATEVGLAKGYGLFVKIEE